MPRKTIAKASIKEDLKMLKEAAKGSRRTISIVKAAPKAVIEKKKKPVLEQKIETTKKFINFHVEKSEYAIDIMSVIKIESWVNTSNELIDLNKYFGQGVTPADDKNIVLVIQVKEKIIGLLANGVSEILTIEEAEIKPANTELEKSITGIIQYKNKKLLVIDADQLKNFQRL